MPPAVAVAAVVEFAVTPTGGWAFWLLMMPYNFVEPAASIGVWGVFIAVAVACYRHEFPQFTRMAYWSLPVYAVVFAIAVDWDRWFLLPAPVWVPMVLITLQHVLTPAKQLEKDAETGASASTGKTRAQRGAAAQQKTLKQ